MPALIRRQIEGRSYKECFALEHAFTAAIHLQPQEGFLNQIICIVDTTSAAAEEPAQFKNEKMDFVHTITMT